MNVCRKAPPGWFCTRDGRHDGPCAAVPVSMCLPFRHDWELRKVSVPMWDASAKGELRRCRRCGKVKAK